MALIKIEYGALASSEVMNNNFEYLDNRVSSVAESMTTYNAGIYSNIASINTLITNMNYQLRPIGQPLIRLDNTIFEDEIRLEGAEVSRTTYSALFEIYSITYGAGDGVSTFNLPDFRGRVAWGNESFGYIEAGLPNISGRITIRAQSDSPNGAFYTSSSSANRYKYEDGGSTSIMMNASRSSSIYGNSTTVQPPAVSVRWVTRYK